MKLIEVTCPKCNAVMKIDDAKKELICEYCKNKILIDDDNDILKKVSKNVKDIVLYQDSSLVY